MASSHARQRPLFLPAPSRVPAKNQQKRSSGKKTQHFSDPKGTTNFLRSFLVMVNQWEKRSSATPADL